MKNKSNIFWIVAGVIFAIELVFGVYFYWFSGVKKNKANATIVTSDDVPELNKKIKEGVYNNNALEKTEERALNFFNTFEEQFQFLKDKQGLLEKAWPDTVGADGKIIEENFIAEFDLKRAQYRNEQTGVEHYSEADATEKDSDKIRKHRKLPENLQKMRIYYESGAKACIDAERNEGYVGVQKKMNLLDAVNVKLKAIDRKVRREKNEGITLFGLNFPAAMATSDVSADKAAYTPLTLEVAFECPPSFALDVMEVFTKWEYPVALKIFEMSKIYASKSNTYVEVHEDHWVSDSSIQGTLNKAREGGDFAEDNVLFYLKCTAYDFRAEFFQDSHTMLTVYRTELGLNLGEVRNKEYAEPEPEPE